MTRRITSINLEGLSDEGRESLRKITYEENAKSTKIAYVLLFTLGGFGGHRHYIGQHKLGWAIALISIFIGIITIKFNERSIQGVYALTLIFLEFMLLGSAITNHNNRLALQLEQEINV